MSANILVVDDDKDIADLLVVFVESLIIILIFT